MPRFNPKNFGVVIGRLSQDKRVFQHQGFSTVMLKIAVDDNYKDKNGRQNTQFLSFQQNIDQPNPGDGLGVYEFIEKGDLVQITYQARNNNYMGKDNKMVYEDIRAITNIVMLESKAVKNDRKQRQAQMSAQTPPTPPQMAEPSQMWQPMPQQQGWQPQQTMPQQSAYAMQQPTGQPVMSPDIVMPQTPAQPQPAPQPYGMPSPNNQFSQYMPSN